MTDARRNPLDRLSAADVEVVRRCLAAAVRGPFFAEREFGTLFGLERREVEEVLRRWPDSGNPAEQDLAVTNSLNNLLGYPHRQCGAWDDLVSVPPREVARVLARWLAE